MWKTCLKCGKPSRAKKNPATKSRRVIKHQPHHHSFRTVQNRSNLAVFLISRAHIYRSTLHFITRCFCKNSCIHFTILKEFVFTDDVSRETIFHQCGVFVENLFRKDVAYFALKNKNRGKNPGCLMCFCKNRFPSTFSIL